MRNQSYTEGAAPSSAIDQEVKNANRENREVQLTDEQLAQLGHAKRPLTKVIRSFCLACVGDQPSMVRKCTSPGCSLWPYRLGVNVYSARKGNPDAFKSSASTPISERRTAEPPNTGNGSSEGGAE